MNYLNKTVLSFTVVSLVLFAAGTARADWDPQNPAKWVQLPDLTIDGMDVLASFHTPVGNPTIIKGLADDFECTGTGPITGIHIWGSWYNDLLPLDSSGAPDAGNVTFAMGIFSDIPADQSGLGYSIPGEPLWARIFAPGEFTFREYHSFPANEPEGEGWFEPDDESASGGYYSPNADKKIWQYNFSIEEQAFIQEGTPGEPVVYWLALTALPVPVPGGLVGYDVQPYFGWKTSPDHWNDDAAWIQAVADPNGTIQGPDGNYYSLDPWYELRYPPEHPNQDLIGNSIDLAFVITPEAATLGVLLLGGLVLLRRRR